MGQMMSSSEADKNHNTKYMHHPNGESPTKPRGRSTVVVIPIDGTTQAERAFNWYIGNSHKPGNVVRLIYVHETGFRSASLMPDMKAVELSSEVHAQQVKRDKTASIIELYEKKLSDNQVPGGVDIVYGRPDEKIVSHAKRLRANHIVMGRQGYGIIRRMILGSISQYVMDNSGIPVTVIPKETRSYLF